MDEFEATVVVQNDESAAVAEAARKPKARSPVAEAIRKELWRQTGHRVDE